MKRIVLVVAAFAASAVIPKNNVLAAAIMVQQMDGSVSAAVGTGCNNACSNVSVASQVFMPVISAKVGAIKVFTSNFGTASRYPQTNSCYLNLYNDDTNTLLASSENGFSGFECAGDLTFSFNTSQPYLQGGAHYRWEYVFGGQNFSGVTFAGSPDNTVGGIFSAPSVVNAKFVVYAAVAPPVFLSQSAEAVTIAEGDTMNASSVTIGATLPSALPDILQLQAEVEPSFVEFKNQPNLTSIFLDSGSVARVTTSGLLLGGYHWQARTADAEGNVSSWLTMSAPPANPDFIVHDPSSDIVLQDAVTSYNISTAPNPCFGDSTIFSCAPSPAFNNYMVGAPFQISKITFNWQNAGSNNCDGIGNYGAIITSANATSSVVATSTNTIYMGCAGPVNLHTGEFDFSGQTVPKHFFITFGAFDGGLQAGSGISITNVQIYTSAEKEPVVIVPGIFGSVHKNGQWILQPIFKPYDALKATLIANGYVQDKTLFDFPYDWEHESIPVIAHELANRIGQIKTVCGCQKVNVIAHSMGGLVVRHYVESGLYQDDIDQLIFLGVPHLGSPLAYLAWEGGTTLFSNQLDLIAVLEKALIRQEAIEAGFSATHAHSDLQIYRYIHSSSSPVYAFQELLPTYDYLRDMSTGTFRAYPVGYPANDFLDHLNAAPALDMMRASGIKAVNFYSQDQFDTVTAFGIKDDASKSPLWSDGMPFDFERGDGDATVPRNSATAIDIGEQINIGGAHFDLPTSAEGQIVRLLTGIIDPIIVPPPPSLERYLSIFPFSPIDILVTAPDGAKIGKDPLSGKEIGEIPGAFYSGSDSPNEYIIIPDPADGQYRITTQGTATGTYRMIVSYGYRTASSATSSELEFRGSTHPYLIKEFSVGIDQHSPLEQKLVSGGKDADDSDDNDSDLEKDRARRARDAGHQRPRSAKNSDHSAVMR